MPRDGEFTLKAAFAASGLDVKSLDGSTADEMQKSAAMLVSFVKENQIEADQSVKTGKDGAAGLKDMERGLYLICQSGNENPDIIVTSQPFFVSLPMMKHTEGVLSWQYDVTAVPKLEVTVPETEPTKTEPSESEPTETEPPETKPEESQPEESQPEETQPPADVPDHPGGNSGGSAGGNSAGNATGGPGEDSFITVTDTPVPLASFDPPGGLDLIEIEDEPVPLGAFPFVPKMGDMGTGVFVAGMILSFLFGCCALICRNKYTGKEQ